MEVFVYVNGVCSVGELCFHGTDVMFAIISHDVVCCNESRNVPTGFFGQVVVDCPIICGSSGTAYGFVDSAWPAVVSCQYQVPVLIDVI